jgi:outer membrane immunogenic protein
MKKLTILAAGLSTLIAAPALAGGVGEPAPAPVVMAPAPMAPSMSWTGGSVGAQLGYGDASASGGLEGDGALLGLRAYYDYDFGNFIVGGGLQYDGTNIEVGGSDVDAITRAGLRAGVDLGESWVYGTGGWASVQTDDAVVGDSDGWFAGVGYERFITTNMTVGAEVLYHEFDEFDAAGFEADGTSAAVSVNFRF